MCLFHVNIPNQFGAKSIGIALKCHVNVVCDSFKACSIMNHYIQVYIHLAHMRLSNRFGTDSNRFGRHVNASKSVQIDGKPIWPKAVRK